MNYVDRKKQLGMSLIEILVASAVSLVVIVGVVDLTSKVSNNQVKQNQGKESFYSQEAALTVAKSILFDVYSSKTSKRTEGLCRNLSVDNARPGINYVELILDFNFFEDNDRWVKKLPSDWKIVECDKKFDTKSRYEKCFKLNNENQAYFLAVGLNLVNIDAKNGKIENFPKNKNKADIKTVAFDFNAIVFNQEKNAVKSNELFVPAADVGYCELKRKRWLLSKKNTKEEYYKVYPSGSGLVDDAGKSIYNSTSFAKNKSDLLDFKLLKPSVQVGKLNSENISVDSRYNVEITCNEKKFKCSKNASDRIFDDTLDIDMILSYNPGRVFPDNINSDVSISFSSNKSSISVKGKDIDSQINKGQFLPLKKGTNNYSVSVENINGTCNKICKSVEKGSFYKGNFSFELYRGLGKKKELLKDKPETFSSHGEIACTTCYMKSCARLGLGTFGPVQRTNYSDGHPIEPLDGNIPECAVQDSKSVKSFSKVNKMSISSESCLSGHFSGGNLVLKKETCSKKLPVMCFTFGKFRLARNIDSGKLIKATKNKSHKICFEQGLEILGREKVEEWLNLKELEKYFDVSGNKLKFINLANQGFFTAPQTDEQISDTVRVFRKNLTSLSQKFWIGYDLNASGHTVGSLPLIYNTQDSLDIKESALFFGLNSTVNIESPSNTLKSFSNTIKANKAGILLHNLKHKGVAFVDSEQTKSLSYVCFNEELGFFISTKTGTKYVDGVSVCKREKNNALFYPPQTPLQWSSILLKLNKNEYDKPFPYKADKYHRAAWVAVEPLGGGSTSYNKGKYPLHPELLNLPLEDKSKNRYESVYDLIKSRRTVPGILNELR